jgi:uncharacterized membrane protein
MLQNDSSNILFATCATVFLVWQLKVNIDTGLSLHLLGSTVLTLMFRWCTAIIANAVIVLGMTLLSSADFEAFAMNALLTGVVPISFSFIVWRLNEKYLPANYFVYLFVAAFFPAALSMLGSGFLSYGLLSLLDNQIGAEMLDGYRYALIPIMYPEAFLTGAVISIFVIYKPEWIATFDDRRYLNRR